jgi:HPt (histidine-containing phosphotransfer) domain-containing protein
MIKVSKEEYYNVVCAQLPELDYKMGLSTCMGDADFYLELLNDFSELPIKDELERFFKEEDAHNYCIKVHGFKNNAYTIGAREIGDLAYELEKLTRDSAFDKVPRIQIQMFELYDNVCKRYNEVIVI